MWDLAILEKTGMGHSLSPIGTLGLLGGFSGICLGACFFPQGGAHGVLHRNCVQKRQDAADWETRKPKILDIFSLTKHKPPALWGDGSLSEKCQPGPCVNQWGKTWLQLGHVQKIRSQISSVQVLAFSMFFRLQPKVNLKQISI